MPQTGFIELNTTSIAAIILGVMVALLILAYYFSLMEYELFGDE